MSHSGGWRERVRVWGGQCGGCCSGSCRHRCWEYCRWLELGKGILDVLDNIRFQNRASNEKIKQMLDKTTQHYRGVMHYPFRKQFKSYFPGANVPRSN